MSENIFLKFSENGSDFVAYLLIYFTIACSDVITWMLVFPRHACVIKALYGFNNGSFLFGTNSKIPLSFGSKDDSLINCFGNPKQHFKSCAGPCRQYDLEQMVCCWTQFSSSDN